jgi:hypothetical protein
MYRFSNITIVHSVCALVHSTWCIKLSHLWELDSRSIVGGDTSDTPSPDRDSAMCILLNKVHVVIKGEQYIRIT